MTSPLNSQNVSLSTPSINMTGGVDSKNFSGVVSTNETKDSPLSDSSNLPLTREGFLDDTKRALQYFAMTRNQPKLQREILQLNMVQPQQYLDTSKTDRDFARSQRGLYNALQSTDAIANRYNAIANQANINEEKAKINDKVQAMNMIENQRVQKEMNDNKQLETDYKNEQIAIDNKAKIAKAYADNQNMINFSNLAYDAVMKGGQNDADLMINKKNVDRLIAAKKQDKINQFNKENSKLIEEFRKSSNKKYLLEQEVENLNELYENAVALNDPEASTIKQELERRQQELSNEQKVNTKLENEYNKKYNQYLGTLESQMVSDMRNRTNMLGLNPLFRNSNKYAHKVSYTGTPFHVKKKGGSLTLEERKELELYKTQLKSVLEDKKETEKIRYKKIKDYIQERKRATKSNNDKIWKIVSKIAKI